MIEKAEPLPRRTVLVTRPKPQAVVTARLLHRAGHRVLIDSLLSVQGVPTAPIDPAGVAAILLTSANGTMGFEPRLARLPVLAVGATTAAAARRKGWADAQSADGDARSLVTLVRRSLAPAAGALLHLAGEDGRPGLGEALTSAGYDYRRIVVYRAAPAYALASVTARALRAADLDAVLFFSPRTAGVFRALVEAAGLAGALARSHALCLSEDVALRVRAMPWQDVHVSARRDQEALLACLEAVSVAW